MLIHSRAVGALMPALAVFAAASSRAEAPFPAERGTIVVTGHRVADEIRQVEKTPGGVDIVPAEEFRDRLAVSLRDALAFSPGVYAQPRFGQEVRLSIRGSGISRGFHMRGIMLFQDGIPINLADNNGDFQEFDPQVFESIAVYRGSNALRFGGSTLGGAINATTPTGRSATGVTLRVDGGSFDTVRGKAAVGFATPRGDAFLALTTDTSDGDHSHSRRDSIRFNGNAGVRMSDAIETRFYASVNHIDQRLPGALTRPQALETPTRSLDPNIVGDQQRNIDSIRLQNRTTIMLGAGTLAAGAFVNAKQLFHPIFQVVDQKSFDYGAFARLDLGGEIAGLPVEASLGATARFGHVQNRQYLNIRGRRGAQTVDGRQEANTVDAYGELRVKPVADLSLVAGGVLTEGRRAVENYRDANRSGSARFTAFSPKLGLLYEPLEALQFYANASRSVELPGFIELNQTPFQAGGAVAPGFVAVTPQRAWTFDIGSRGTLGAVKWDITFYRASVRGELLQFDQGSGVPAATFNADRTRHQGIEAGVDIRVAKWATLRQVYQLNDFRFRGDAGFDDNRLPVVAEHLYRASLRIGSERLSISPNLEWVPRGAWADYRNTTRVPGYILLGIGGEAVVGDGLRLFVDARNLTGRKAIGDISAVVQANDASAIYYPVERRAVYVGAQAAF